MCIYIINIFNVIFYIHTNNPTIQTIKFKSPVFINFIIGLITNEASGVIHNIINAIYNILSCDSNQSLCLLGRSATNILDPSSGGSGIKLNTPRPTFIDIILTIINETICPA